MKQKLFTLLTLLLCVASGAWAEGTTAKVIAEGDQYYSAYAEAKTNLSTNNWVTTSGSPGNSGSSYTAPSGWLDGGSGKPGYGYMSVQSGRKVIFTVKNITSVSILGCSNNNSSRTINLSVKEGSTEVGTVATKTTSSNSTPEVLTYGSALDKTKTYTITVSASDGNNAKFHQIKFVGAPASSGFTITFAGNGNTSGIMSNHTDITSGSDVAALNANAFAKTGSSFAGWKTNTALTYVAYGSEDIPANQTAVAVDGIVPDKAKIKNVTSNITLTAQWNAIDYAITHTAASNGTYTIKVGDASATDESTTANYGQTITLAATPASGYGLSAWNVTKTASSDAIEVTDNQFTMPAEAVTVAPTFALQYVVTFNLQGHGSAIAAQNIISGGKVTEPATPTATGYVFRGWYKEAECTNKWDFSTDVVTATTELFAKWVTANTLFSMTAITGPTSEVAKGKKSAVTATFSSGASAEVYNGHGSSAATFVQGSTMNLNSSGASYLHITLPTMIEAGDVVDFGNLTGAIKIGVTTNQNNATTKAFPYVISESDATLIGSKDLYFFKDGSATFTSLTIQGEGQIANLAITSSATPNIDKGATSTITHTSSSDGEITYSSSDTGVATVSSEGVITAASGGTAVITITQAATATYRKDNAKVTVTVPETAIIKVKVGGGTSATVTGTIGGTADVKLQSDKKFGSGHWAGFTLASANTFKTGDVIEVRVTTEGAGNFIFYDSKEKTNTILTTTVTPTAGIHRFVLPAAVNGKTSIYLVRGAEGFNPFIDYIAVYRPDAVVTLNASGYATYSRATDFTFDGAKAYKMALNEGTKTIAGTEVSGKIAAGEGILLKGEASAPVAIMETTGAVALADNDLKGSTKSDGSLADKPDFCYVLSGDTFKKYTGATLAANKAYFEATSDLAGHAFTITFDDGETTAIKAVEAKKFVEDNKFFNLAGQRVAQPTKGLYIVNGKKVIVK